LVKELDLGCWSEATASQTKLNGFGKRWDAAEQEDADEHLIKGVHPNYLVKVVQTIWPYRFN
jgi:hypothetical protein